MNKIKFIVSVLTVILGFVCISPSDSLAAESRDLTSVVSEDELRSRVSNLSSDIDVKYSRKIGNYIRTYIQNPGGCTNDLLGRVTNYFPLIEAEIRKRNLPDELKVLAIVESSLRPTVRSSAGAVGMWQFMQGTGKQYGLTINRSIDERRDPLRSTEAAMDYLHDLHKRFGDWTLALAAYNCGPGRVSRAIRSSGGHDFWSIQAYLPSETREYVPKFIAALYIMNYYYMHDLSASKPKIDLHATSLTKVYRQISFKDISSKTGMSLETIKKMNPAFIRHYIPENLKGYNLLLPEHSMYVLLESMGKIDKSILTPYTSNDNSLVINLRNIYTDHSTLFGRRTISNMAPVDYLDLTNTVDFKSRKAVVKNPQNVKTEVEDNNGYELYRLGKRESILDVVSRRKDLKLEDVLALNDITLSSPPKPGSQIKLKKLSP